MLVGVGAGLGLCVGPIFLAEIAPSKIQGAVGRLLFRVDLAAPDIPRRARCADPVRDRHRHHGHAGNGLAARDPASMAPRSLLLVCAFSVPVARQPFRSRVAELASQTRSPAGQGRRGAQAVGYRQRTICWSLSVCVVSWRNTLADVLQCRPRKAGIRCLQTTTRTLRISARRRKSTKRPYLSANC